MAGQPAKQASVEDGLGEDILAHVTPKWVDWYRETMRRTTQDDDEQSGKAAADSAHAGSQGPGAVQRPVR
ncbi:MAG: hypothetical protein ACO27F_02935 [Beijerinckiaceae bacterium]|jgi:hypothetical protein